MDKHKIIMPDVEGFARPETRRGFLKALAAAGKGAAAGSVLLGGTAEAQTYGASQDAAAAPAPAGGGGDLEIANFALTLEYLESTFYATAYATALDADVLSGNALAVVDALAAHEAAHVDALIGLITQAGGTPVAQPEFVFPDDAFSSQASVLALAGTFEPVGVGAYLGAAPMIVSPDVLAAAGSIAGVEGEHVVAVNWLNGVVPPANTALPAALTMDEVLAAVAPFMGMGEMPATGGGPASKGSARSV
ncbi:MAG TPA: ferritin-like domain-containing protein [Rubrobacteraceae bacterium]|nr:ferritin-like domain-containing protein [Rubrobacteraceae bacterium]